MTEPLGNLVGQWEEVQALKNEEKMEEYGNAIEGAIEKQDNGAESSTANPI